MNHPLHWPTGWKRTARPTLSRFGKITVAHGVHELLAELERLGALEAIISTNVPVRLDGLPRSGEAAPDDPGVAVYYTLKGERYVLACDAWNRVPHNLRAIARHIEALRGIDRWGVGSIEQAFSGYLRLTAGDGDKPTRSCWEVLDLPPPPWPSPSPVTEHEVRMNYRALARDLHPDAPSGSTEAFSELGRALGQARAYLLDVAVGLRL